MTTAVDLSLLEALKGPSVSLLARRRIKAAGTGEVYTGFSALKRMNIAIRVDDVAGDSGSSATVLVEQSDDGLVWTTAATHTFTTNDTYRVVVDDPKDQLRTRWTVGTGLRYAVIGAITVVPAFLDPAPRIVEALPSDDLLPALAVYPQVERTKPGLEIQDHLGNTLFRVDADGSVHILTGTSILADL